MYKDFIMIKTVINEYKWKKLLHLRDKIFAPSRRHKNRKRMKQKNKEKKKSVCIAKTVSSVLTFSFENLVLSLRIIEYLGWWLPQNNRESRKETSAQIKVSVYQASELSHGCW